MQFNLINYIKLFQIFSEGNYIQFCDLVMLQISIPMALQFNQFNINYMYK